MSESDRGPGGDMEGLAWEDPGPPPSGRGRVTWFLPTLRANPGKWARLPASPNGLGGYTKRFGPAGFEFTTRDRGNGRVLYARFVAPADEDEATTGDAGVRSVEGGSA